MEFKVDKCTSTVLRILDLNNGWRKQFDRTFSNIYSEIEIPPIIKYFDIRFDTRDMMGFFITIYNDGIKNMFRLDSKSEFKDFLEYTKVEPLDMEFIKNNNLKEKDSFKYIDYEFIIYEDKYKDTILMYKEEKK